MYWYSYNVFKINLSILSIDKTENKEKSRQYQLRHTQSPELYYKIRYVLYMSQVHIKHYYYQKTNLTRKDTRPPYTDGVYIFPIWFAKSKDGLVFLENISLLAVMKAVSTSLLK